MADNQQVVTTKKFQEETVNLVLEKINGFKSNGQIKLPDNYSPENALKSAWLILQEVVDRNQKPVLEACTTASVANALLDMVVQGLNPVKKQCYFIAYGAKLQMSRSYMGTEMLAKRVGGVKEVKANAIYEGDIFEYEVNPQTGRKKVTKHDQKMENLDHEKVKGAYAIVIYADGSVDTEIMNIKQIRQAWNQGAAKGGSPAHKNFTDEMAKKTVINRACKTIINSSDDADLYENTPDAPEDPVTANVQHQIKSNANKETIGFDEAEPAEVVTDGEQQPELNGQSTLSGPGF
jgi:recombination protein RecT